MEKIQSVVIFAIQQIIQQNRIDGGVPPAGAR